MDLASSTITAPLNHCYLTVDSATYAAIESSAFLCAQFAPREQRTTVRRDRTYSGLYFYGIHTYLEFFDAGDEAERRIGDTGLAFGTDTLVALQALHARSGDGLPLVRREITREWEGRHTPWFSSLSPTDIAPETGLSTWIMEYDPSFLAEWHPEVDGNRGITRKEVLQRYAAVLRERPPQPVLKDIVGLVVALDQTNAARLIRWCDLLGYHARTEGESVLLSGPGIELRILPANGSARGIQQIMMRVKDASVQPATVQFGPQSTLTFHEHGTATWTF